MEDLRKLSDILSAGEKRRFALLGLAVFVMALLEVVGVVSVLPFIQLVADPGIVDRNELAHEVYVFFEFTDIRYMLTWAGAGVILLLCLTNGFTIFKTWLQFKISWNVAHQLSMRLLKTYLSRPYEYFLSRNTTEFMAYIMGETTTLTNGVILPIIEFCSRVLVAIIIFILLVYIDPEVALLMFGSLGTAYLIIYLMQRKYLRRIGEERIEYSVKRYVSLQELFNGIKTVQVFDRHNFFADRYEVASKKFTDLQPIYNILVAAPRAILEVLAFGAIVVVTIYLYLTVGDIINIIPRLSLYAVAGYRLLPALQSAFGAVGKLIHSYPVVDKLHDSLFSEESKKWGAAAGAKKVEGPTGSVNGVQPGTRTNRLPLASSISLDHVTFTYESNEIPTIKDISLQIDKGQTVAFVGATGSGKTTLVDLLVGLLRPDEGNVRIDGTPLTGSNITSWRGSIAYVPQDVFLFDDSVARNITLKETLDQVDQQRLEAAAKLADIHPFISEDMAHKYETTIGEKGVRLSGGQRQRLGLARAFFHDPSVLVLDEATSALDNVTERGIIESLDLLPKEITTIVIAHRLSTVRHADRIFLLRDGEIAAAGTYDELVEYSPEFQEMARMA